MDGAAFRHKIKARFWNHAMHRLLLLLPLTLASGATVAQASTTVSAPAAWPAKTYYRSIEVNGLRTFYREAGDPSRPTLLLLHGYPSSSHTYRELIPLLSGHYHVIAPDHLGSGYSDRPDPDRQPYTFDRLSAHVAAFVDQLGLRRYSLYVQDFGAPVGFGLMLEQPDRLQTLIVQNGNAYLDGLTPARQAFFAEVQRDRSQSSVARLHGVVSAESIINGQYLRDVRGRPERVSPDAWTHDLAGLSTHRDQRIQVQLFQDYQNNIAAYPRWQAFLRDRQPPTLVIWGRHDPAFISAGALAYQRDLPKAQVHLLDAGHFAVEEQPVSVAQHVLGFMQQQEAEGHLQATASR